MIESSRRRAAAWPYVRHLDFERKARDTASRWFAARGYPTQTRFPYILRDRSDWTRNIIVPEVADYIMQQRAGFPLHKYIHHGLSSQAMLFNLVGPLIASDDVDPLLNILSSRGLPIPSGRIRGVFEYEDRRVFNEDSGQPTSIDLVLQDERGAPFVFLESKFAEKEFGGCSVFANGDCDGRNPSSQFDLCYLHFIGRTYWSLLEKHGFLSERAGHNVTCILSSYYQFFRELLLAIERDGKFVLLFDSRNPTFLSDGRPGQRGLVPFLLECVPPHLKQQVVTVTVQELVTAIKSSNRHPWISEFERKYGLSAL